MAVFCLLVLLAVGTLSHAAKLVEPEPKNYTELQNNDLVVEDDDFGLRGISDNTISTTLQYTSVGCYRDTRDRAIPTLEGSDERLDGPYRSRSDAIRKCAEVAHSRGFSMFAVQHGGWCASSADAPTTYDKYGPSSSCENDGEGGPWANEVYAFVEEHLVCEHQRLSLSCSAGQIQILSANYGRSDAETCLHPSIKTTECAAESSLMVVKGLCDGEESCMVEAENSVFCDPCVGTFKYLEVTFYCGKAPLNYSLADVEYESIGCFHDTRIRAIPTLEGSDHRLDGNYRQRDNALEKCATAAASRGFGVFAVQNGGWCASSQDAGERYYTYGPSTACRDDGEGGPWANQVYAITDNKLVCEHQTLTLQCTDGTIQVMSANYGRTDGETCPHPAISDQECGAEVSIDVVKEECEDKKSCSVRASNSVFGDPCVGTFKYLQVKYYCAGVHEEDPLLEYESIGCFLDTRERAIPTLEGHDGRLDGYYRQRYDAINKCANAAASRGYSVFAVQNGGWCASSSDALDSYDQYGPSDKCADDGKGGPWANHVYAIVRDTLVCEHDQLTLQCGHGHVHVVRANYGRTTGDETCPHRSIRTTECRAETSFDLVKNQCEGQAECSIRASNSVFGDPCVGTYKYLEVHYTCVRDPSA
ncbi:uncharacterized protein [Ptychodera flava]|uniref:uncharacterized protein n=1 Tax=Ptychodera flava TaxID=63121 RepID=UPI003969D867